MSVLGLGHDVVDVSAFAEQLAEPGSRMRGLFSVREVRQAGSRTNMKITTRDDLPQAEQISLEIRKRLARERMHQVFAQVREQ